MIQPGNRSTLKAGIEPRVCGATGNGMDKDSKGQTQLEDSPGLWGNREQHGQGQQRTDTAEGLPGSVGQQGTAWTRTAKDRHSWRTPRVCGATGNSMDKDSKGQTQLEDSPGLWGNREQHGQGQQRTDTAGGLPGSVGQQGTAWTRTAKDRHS